MVMAENGVHADETGLSGTTPHRRDHRQRPLPPKSNSARDCAAGLQDLSGWQKGKLACHSTVTAQSQHSQAYLPYTHSAVLPPSPPHPRACGSNG